MSHHSVIRERERSPDTVIVSDMCVLTEGLFVNWQLLAGGLMQMCCDRQKNCGVTLKTRGQSAIVCVCVCP